jgi:hypothetical protein
VAIGSLSFDLVDQIGVAWRKPIRCYRLLGTLTYFDYRQNQIGCLTSFGKAISIDSKGDFLQ